MGNFEVAPDANAKHRIAIVSAFFDPALDYLENNLADALSDKHEVIVLTSTRRSQSLLDAGVQLPSFAAGHESVGTVTVLRLEPTFSFGQRIMTPSVRSEISRLNPTLAILVAPSQFFPLAASEYLKMKKVPYLYVTGENHRHGPQTFPRKALAGFYRDFILPWIIRKTMSSAQVVMATTPETQEWVTRTNAKVNVRFKPLPYADHHYFFDPPRGADYRAKMGIPENAHVTTFVGRFDRNKSLNRVIEAWESVAETNHLHYLVMAGLGTDIYSRYISQAINRSSFRSRITLLPFQNHNEVNKILNASDATIWPTVSIGIQQALACGSFVLIAKDSAGEFFLEGVGRNFGASYSPNADSLAAAIERSMASCSLTLRRHRAQFALENYSASRFADWLIPALTLN